MHVGYLNLEHTQKKELLFLHSPSRCAPPSLFLFHSPRSFSFAFPPFTLLKYAAEPSRCDNASLNSDQAHVFDFWTNREDIGRNRHLSVGNIGDRIATSRAQRAYENKGQYQKGNGACKLHPHCYTVQWLLLGLSC